MENATEVLGKVVRAHVLAELKRSPTFHSMRGGYNVANKAPPYPVVLCPPLISGSESRGPDKRTTHSIGIDGCTESLT